MVTAIGKRPKIKIEPDVLAVSLLTIRHLLVTSRKDLEDMNKKSASKKVRNGSRSFRTEPRECLGELYCAR